MNKIIFDDYYWVDDKGLYVKVDGKDYHVYVSINDYHNVVCYITTGKNIITFDNNNNKDEYLLLLENIYNSTKSRYAKHMILETWDRLGVRHCEQQVNRY